jgi:homoisocitrate dehydrogenase
MTIQTICLIPGDGVGREVIPAAAEALAALGIGLRFVEAPAGFEHFKRTGNAIPDQTLAEVESAGVALFGATSSPSTVVLGYRSPILILRKTFDLYANLRPVFSLPGDFSRPGIDLLVVRENTEGLYAGRERREGDTAIAERVITVRGSQRIAKAAFEQARKRQSMPGAFILASRGRASLPARVTIVHKANVLKLTDGLFREACLQVGQEYPDIIIDEMLVDAMAMRLVLDPQRFDVLVTTNMFGDILSDEGSALMGGLGVAPSANLGEKAAVFEPVHGSAPDIAGKGIANPLGAILSGVMLLEYIGQAGAAARLASAAYRTLKAGVLTPDLGGQATTGEVTRRIIAELA